MASKLHLLKSKACQVSKFVSSHGNAFKDQLLQQNKQYIQEPANVETCITLSKQLFHTRVASIPGRIKGFQQEVDYVKNLWKNKQDINVETAAIGALFAVECYGWFCVGEIAGRGFTFTGYYV